MPWVTLLPLSSCGSWVDYVYAYVTLDTTGGKAVPIPEVAETADLPIEWPGEMLTNRLLAEGCTRFENHIVEAPEN